MIDLAVVVGPSGKISDGVEAEIFAIAIGVGMALRSEQGRIITRRSICRRAVW